MPPVVAIPIAPWDEPTAVPFSGAGPVYAIPLGGTFTLTIIGHVPLAFAVGGTVFIPRPNDLHVPFAPGLGGSILIEQAPTEDPEGIFQRTGRRPAFPLLVYAVVDDVDGFADVPDNGSFLMSAGYVPTPLDGLYEIGATPGSVGTRVVRGGLPNVTIFRAPYDNEVVRRVDLDADGAQRDRGYFRWNGTTWVAYVTMPQRALRGMRAFEQLDPESVYDYWASLLGGLQYCLTNDAASLTYLLDANLVPDDYLGLLGSTLGVTVPKGGTIALRRQLVRTAIPRNRLRGLNQGVALRLFLMGYSGYATEVWIDPSDADNWTNLASAPTDVREEITVNRLTVSSGTGVKGSDWIEVGHNSADAYTQYAAGYVPSSRVVIHVNNRDGSPIDADTSAATIRELKQSITEALSADVLPAQVSIRFFATDVSEGVVRYL